MTTRDPATEQKIAELNAQIAETTRLAIEMLHRAHEGPAPIEIDDEGIMHGDGIDVILTNKRSPLSTLDGDIDAIGWHWTDTRDTPAKSLAERIAKPGGRAASCHAWLDRDGLIAQSVSAKHGSWHMGSDSTLLFMRPAMKSQPWVPLTIAQRGKIRGYGANAFAFGVEVINLGELRWIEPDARAKKLGPDYVDGGGKVWASWPFRWDNPDARPACSPRNEVHVTAPGRALHKYTDAQKLGALRIASALVRRYGLTRDVCALGHCQVDPKRRTDPGPLWIGARACGLEPSSTIPERGIMHDVLDEIFGAESDKTNGGKERHPWPQT